MDFWTITLYSEALILLLPPKICLDPFISCQLPFQSCSLISTIDLMQSVILPKTQRSKHWPDSALYTTHHHISFTDDLNIININLLLLLGPEIGLFQISSLQGISIPPPGHTSVSSETPLNTFSIPCLLGALLCLTSKGQSAKQVLLFA